MFNRKHIGPSRLTGLIAIIGISLGIGGGIFLSPFLFLMKAGYPRHIKETTFTDGSTPKDNYYGRQGIFDLAKSPGGRDIHHDVMKFLEESGLYLLCHVTSDEFNQMLKDTHPEGHDSCGDAGIVTKIPF